MKLQTVSDFNLLPVSHTIITSPVDRTALPYFATEGIRIELMKQRRQKQI
jgi:hypothetical protein